MTRSFAWLCIFTALVVPAFAGQLSLLGAGSPGGVAPATLTYVGNVNTTSCSASFTFSSVTLGTPVAGRYIVIAVNSSNGGGSLVNSAVTIAGNAATAITSNAINGNVNARYWIVADAVNSSGNVVLTFTGGTPGQCAIGVYNIGNLISATPVASATSSVSSPTSGSMTTSPNGVMLGSCIAQGVGSGWSWSGLTSNYSVNLTGAEWYTGASATTAGSSNTATCTPTGGSSASVGAFVSLR